MSSKNWSKLRFSVGISLAVHLPLVISSISIIIYKYERETLHEEGDFFEGDMILDHDQYLALTDMNAKNVLRDEKYRWPNATVHFYFDDNIHSDKQRDRINEAMTRLKDIAPCIQFIELQSPEERNDYVSITDSKRGCAATVGYMKKRQLLNVNAKRCTKYGIIAHELMHALGMFHMQSNYNRDEYIKINWENVREGKEINFRKYDKTKVTDFDFDYDYESVMHYSKMAFTKNNKPTMESIIPGKTFGHRSRLSDIDKRKLQKMYCDGKQ